MRTKRTELEATIIRQARTFVEACGDGLGLGADPDAYMAWFELGETLDEYEMLVPDDIATPVHRANLPGADTQHIAASLIVPDQLSTRYKLLVQYRIRAALPGYDDGEWDGLTDSEAEHVLKRAHTTVSSARNFLAEGGWIVDSGHRRLTPSKRPAIVWVLTKAGADAFDFWQVA